VIPTAPGGTRPISNQSTGEDNAVVDELLASCVRPFTQHLRIILTHYFTLMVILRQ